MEQGQRGKVKEDTKRQGPKDTKGQGPKGTKERAPRIGGTGTGGHRW